LPADASKSSDLKRWVNGRIRCVSNIAWITSNSRFGDSTGRYIPGYQRIEEAVMLALVLVLLLILALGGAGFAASWLWIIAGVLLVVWLLGFTLRPAGGSARWYRW
jgi:hypothetical protein